MLRDLTGEVAWITGAGTGIGESGAINLEWIGGSNGVLSYNIYRDGTLYDTSPVNFYTDSDAENDREYCYRREYKDKR